jgi:hypothetical protein
MAQTTRRRSIASTVNKAQAQEKRARRNPPTADSFQNFASSVGMGTRNLHSASTYGFNPLSRERTLLEWMYRGSWICGIAVDSVADDMVKMGVDFGGTLPPDDGENLEKALADHQIWNQLNELIKWGRLYGGAIAVMMVDGQDPATPLRIDTVTKGQFRGLLVLDRWMVEPSLNNLVSDAGPDLGLPKFYKITADAPALPRMDVHYSRCFRYTGVDLPYWQKIAENMWGISIYERLWDRLTAFDSATQGVAQLIYRAYLRWVKIKNLREMIGAGGKRRDLLLQQIDMMRMFQSNEGISLLDAEDEFGASTYSFAGLDTALLQFGQQLSGALQIPLVRLFGQSPAGLNATGESDLRLFYDGIHQQQEMRLRRPLTKTINILARSEGIKLPDTFAYTFRALWQLTTKEKAEVAELTTRTVLSADELGVISRKTTLEELRQSGRETGVWSTISDEDIEAASADLPPAPAEASAQAGGVPGMPVAPGAGERPGPGSEVEGEPGQGETGKSTRLGPGLAPIQGGAQRPRLPVPPPRVTLGRGEAA